MNCRFSNSKFLVYFGFIFWFQIFHIIACYASGIEKYVEFGTLGLKPSNNNPILFEDFESENPLGFVHHQFPEKHSFERSDKFAFKGKFSGKFELRYGDRKATSSGIRTEVLFPVQAKNERWYSFAVLFPENGFDYDNDDELITQWHQSGLGTPSASLRIRRDKIFFRVGNVQPNGNAEIMDFYDFGKLPRNEWHEFVFHFIHSNGDDGLLEIWRNGVKIVERKGGNMYEGELPRWKIGIYKARWEKEATDTKLRIVFFDNVKLGDEKATLKEMTTPTDEWSSGLNIPEKPVLVSPQNNTVGFSGGITLKWSKPEGAEKYRVQIARDKNFNNKQYDLYNIPVNSIDISKLDVGTQYYWRVSASNTIGSGDFSEIWGFQTLGVPDVPNLKSPTNGIKEIGRDIKFEWDKALNSDSYRVQVSTVRDFSQMVVNIGSVRDNFFYLTNLDEGQIYYWRVRSSNIVGNSSFSEVWDFTTKASKIVPDKPLLLFPKSATITQGDNVSLEWSKVNSADFYHVEVSKFSNFSQSIVFSNSKITFNKVIVQGLEYDQTYFWRVRAGNEIGFGSYSSVWNFKTDKQAVLELPKLISPTNLDSIDSNIVFFSWEYVQEAKEYQVEISDDVEFKENVLIHKNIKKTSLNLENLEKGKRYYWKVKVNAKGLVGESEIWSFKVLDNNENYKIIDQISVKAYPNPFSGKFNLEFSKALIGEVLISIQNSHGIILHEEVLNDLNESIQITVPEYWSQGVYMIRIQGFGFHLTKKMIKN